MTRMIYDVSRKEEASLEKGFLDIVKTVYFTPENAHFYRTEGGFAALKAYLPADSGNDLRENEGGGSCEWRDLGRVFFHRAFPYDLPDGFISVLDKDSKEHGMIRSISDFDGESAEIINSELARKYFTPHITKIHSVKERFGYSYWDVESDRGRLSFAMHDTFRNITKISENRVVLNDVDGNRYEIDDVLALDGRSYRRIELYL